MEPCDDEREQDETEVREAAPPGARWMDGWWTQRAGPNDAIPSQNRGQPRRGGAESDLSNIMKRGGSIWQRQSFKICHVRDPAHVYPSDVYQLRGSYFNQAPCMAVAPHRTAQGRGYRDWGIAPRLGEERRGEGHLAKGCQPGQDRTNSVVLA